MGVAGEHAMESFCLSQLQSKEGENCSPTKLGDFCIPVNKLLDVVLHVGKKAKFGVKKANGGQDTCICSRGTSVGNGKNFEKP